MQKNRRNARMRAAKDANVLQIQANQREKVWFKTVDDLIASFLIPLVAMLLIYMQRGIFPFGDRSFLRTDMYHQYAPFFSEFQNKLNNGNSLLYSWNIGLGVNFSALYAYYLASPLNWLVALVPKEFVLEFMTYMIVFKIALCGLSFAYYLSKHGKKENAGIAFFGTFYALSGYMAAYNWNIMWLDCIILFPLICLGLERLVFKKKGLLYAITLGVSILSNYYISIMICLFMVIYFFALCAIKRKMRFSEFVFTGIRFAFYSLVAGGLSAIVLVPEVYALQYTASASVKFPEVFKDYFSIISMLARHMPGVETEIGLDHWPNIFCGVAIYLFVVLYILNRKIDVKEKVIYFTMITILLASFSVDVLNYIWHGLHYPNSLPARQSFIYIFLVLYICYRAYYNLRWNSMQDLGAASISAILFVLFAQHSVKEKHFTFGVFYASIVLLGIYAYLVYLYKLKKCSVNLVMILATFMVLLEATFNTGITSVSTVNRTDYKMDNIAVQKLVENVPKVPFYRFEKVTRKTKNDGAWMNFRSVSLFSSTARKSLSEFFRRVGVESSTNAYSITGSTPLVDMLFAVKYGIYTGESNIPYLSLVGNIENTYMYENPYTLPLGYMVGPGFEGAWDRGMENPADVQNLLAQKVEAPDVLVPQQGNLEGQDFYNFTTDKAGEYYIFVTNPSVEDVRVKTVSTGSEQTFDHVNRGFLLEIGYFQAGEEISVSNTNSKSMDMVAYRFDIDALSMVYNQLSKSPWQISLVTDNYIEGMVEAGSDVQGQEVLMTSIPFDKGWKVMVDGVEVQAREGLGAFLAVDLPPGEHRVSMEFMPEGLIQGAMVSGGSLGLVLLIFIVTAVMDLIKRTRSRRRSKQRERVREKGNTALKPRFGTKKEEDAEDDIDDGADAFASDNEDEDSSSDDVIDSDDGNSLAGETDSDDVIDLNDETGSDEEIGLADGTDSDEETGLGGDGDFDVQDGIDGFDDAVDSNAESGSKVESTSVMESDLKAESDSKQEMNLKSEIGSKPDSLSESKASLNFAAKSKVAENVSSAKESKMPEKFKPNFKLKDRKNTDFVQDLDEIEDLND